MRLRSSILTIVFWSVIVSAGGGAEYYVAPTGGSDSNNGSLASPFASFGKAIGLVAPGDTIFARGGTYNLASRITIDKPGAADNPINLFAYPGETPILDFAAQATGSSNRGMQLTDKANWWHFKGLTIQNAGDNGFYTEGDDGVFEQLVTRWNEDSGLQLHGTATRNLVLNCDSYGNYDAANGGENADGFAAKFENLGPGNVIRGSRAWGNSDDGWDMWNGFNGVLVENSWSFANGFNNWNDSSFQGDGTGFKLGHDSGPHVLVNVLAWGNAHNGIDINGNGISDETGLPNGSKVGVYNSVSLNNGGNNWRFDEDIAHVLRNNVSLKTAGGSGDVIYGPVDDAFNTWNGIPVNAADFLSLSDTIARGPRNPDGSLPVSDFLKLAADSNLINAGTPISFVFNGVTYNIPYNGSAPDLGAYETGAPAPALPGDYNGDNTVDARDYTIWRDYADTAATLPNDTTPGTVDMADYEVWRAHFGETLPGAGGAAIVPEPTTILFLGVAVASLVAARRARSHSSR